MSISRRQFIKRTGLATAGTLFSPSLFSSPFVRRAMADTIGNRYLIMLFLDGGNDGLNTVVPLDDATGSLRNRYTQVRNAGGLQIPIAELSPTAFGTCLGTGTSVALHPGLIGLKSLQTDYNRVAVIQGCGYPEPDGSHDVSANIWQTGSRFIPTNLGWLGAHLAHPSSMYGSSHIPGICVESGVGLDFQQTTTNVLAIRRLSSFRFPFDGSHNSDNAAKKTAFHAMYEDSKGSLQAIARHVGTVGDVTATAADNYPPLSMAWDADRPQFVRDGYDTLIDNDGFDTADRLREISRIIYGVENGVAGVDSHFFRLRAEEGSFDTHAGQGGGDTTSAHYFLHRGWGDSVEWFYRDMVDMGVADRVLIVVWSEFSRRVNENDDNGTDHGSQGPMFVIGGLVNGGIYGSHPDINTLDDGNTVYSQAAGNDYRSTDFRDVYGTVLKHWVNMDETDVQGLLPLDPAPPDPMDNDYYWLTAGFDIGFLP